MGRKPVNKIRANKPEVKEKWIQKLKPVLLENGLKKFTMDEIAGILGISKATLYKHFSTRFEIFDAVVEQTIQEILKFDDHLIDESVEFEARYSQAVSSVSIKMAGISNQFLFDLNQLYPDLWEKVIAFQDLATDRVREFYQRGIDQNILRDFNPELLALADRIFINRLADPEFLINNNLTLHSAIEEYFSVKRQGIFKRH